MAVGTMTWGCRLAGAGASGAAVCLVRGIAHPLPALGLLPGDDVGEGVECDAAVGPDGGRERAPPLPRADRARVDAQAGGDGGELEVLRGGRAEVERRAF